MNKTENQKPESRDAFVATMLLVFFNAVPLPLSLSLSSHPSSFL